MRCTTAIVAITLFAAVGAAVAAPAAPAVPAPPADPPVVVVGNDLADLAPTFSRLGLSPTVVGDVGRIPDNAQAVLVLGATYDTPRQLSGADVLRLQAVCDRGGRVYVEFAQAPGGQPLFGATTAPDVRRALFERLVVLKRLGSLAPEDLLEEHDSAYVPFERLPSRAETLLEYDRALGTYHRIPTPEPGVFTATVDLTSEQALSSVSQRYGAGQPNYYPESVELWLSSDGRSYHRVARVEQQPLPETVRFMVVGEKARFVRLVARKLRRSPVTDFLFMGEIEVRDAVGANLALGKAYTLESSQPQSPPYADNGRKLTDGVIEGGYQDHLSVGWGTPPPPDQKARFPGLVRIPWGKGEAILSAPRLSDFRRRNFRLTSRWEELWRQVVISLLPPGQRSTIAARYVPLEAYTEPRVWATPGTPVRLIVRTAPGAEVRATASGKALTLTRSAAGPFEATFTATEGATVYTVAAKTATGSAMTTVPFDCKPRLVKYREALDRNMGWFTRSGVLPKPDGTAGVHSQVCMAWLDSAMADPLGSEFRVDCNAMSATALYLYGLVSGEAKYRDIACNIADTVLAHQYIKPRTASLGGFPWLYERNETIFFWDDNSRIGNSLLWMYNWTGEERYLRGALLNAELFRQVARDDTCVHRHAIQAGELNSIGREAYRQFSDAADPDYRLTHWWTLAAVTGDPTYRKLAEECTRLWGTSASEGAAYAAQYTHSPDLRQRLGSIAAGFLRDPNVQRFGMTTVGGGGYELAFVGDCSIATGDGEPLTDQIYGTPWRFRDFLRAWRATGDATCRRACEAVGDYLVRIQFASPDKRLDGCWMRGFDVDNWEYYGAPYDPAYGPYSAYTGWMNAVADEAFAWYLLGEAPFVAPGRHPEAARTVADVRAMNPKLVSDGPNVALHCPYKLSDAGLGPYGDDGKRLTDGIIDGPYGDHLSVGWGIPVTGQARRITMDLDLQGPRRLKLITQQYGAGRGTYNPDEVRVLASVDGKAYREIGRQTFASQGAGLLWLMLGEPVEAQHLRFELTKQRRSQETDFLFVGETKAWEDGKG